MRISACFLPIIALLPLSARAADAPRASWGKAGVSFDQYREEAALCARAGLSTDVSDMKAVKTLIAASRQIDSLLSNSTVGSTASATTAAGGDIDPVALNNAQQVARITEGANPRARFREVRGALQGTVDQCLTDRGYVRFQLTATQRDRLTKLRAGTAERHAYLHSLASDPRVLATQRATVEVLPADAPATLAPAVEAR